MTCIYVVALVLSSLFSAQSMVLAAYPAERFAAAAQQTISSAYTEQLLGIQGAVGESLTAARDDLWSDLEAVRASLDTGESSLDAEKMLAKYRGQTSDGFDPMSDTSYLALEAALDDVANKDFEEAKAEVDNALAALDAEDNETAKAKVAQEIEQIVQQKKRKGLTAEQTDALSAQLTNAIQRQAALTARAEGHQRIRSDLQRVQNSLEKGTTLAAQSIDQLEKTLLQKEQDPAQLRSLLDTALNNADAGMDMKSSAGLRAALEEYISLLDTNTVMVSRIAALDDADAVTDADNWQGVWSERLNSLRSEVATSSWRLTQRQIKSKTSTRCSDATPHLTARLNSWLCASVQKETPWPSFAWCWPFCWIWLAWRHASWHAICKFVKKCERIVKIWEGPKRGVFPGARGIGSDIIGSLKGKWLSKKKGVRS